jgi:hypothetical protein
MDKSQQDIDMWYKKIELIGIEIKSLEQDMDTGRFKLKTRFVNQHFINELDKIGLQLINITGTFDGKLTVLLEGKIEEMGPVTTCDN